MRGKYKPLGDQNDPRHGTPHAYCNLDCRCDRCRAAWREYSREVKERRPPLSPEDPRHGTNNGYVNHNCRCPDCTEAHGEASWLSYQRRKANR